MIEVVPVSTQDELYQVHQLNGLNLKENLSYVEQESEGFVTWLYSEELLMKMHLLAPSIVAKEEDKVVGYALTTLREAASFHKDLQGMFQNLQHLKYKERPLLTYSFYCMGQLCIAKKYRGLGMVSLLYNKHAEMYKNKYEFLITEISVRNIRSLKVHEKIGFRPIYQYKDATDEWKVVLWDWQ